MGGRGAGARARADVAGQLTPMTLVELSPTTSIRLRRSAWLVAAAAAVVLVGVAGHGSDPVGRACTCGSTSVRPRRASRRSDRSLVRRPWLGCHEDAVWVTSQFDEELYRVDPTTNRVVDTFSIPDHIEGVRAVGGWLWLRGYEPNEVIRVDPVTGALITGSASTANRTS